MGVTNPISDVTSKFPPKKIIELPQETSILEFSKISKHILGNPLQQKYYMALESNVQIKIKYDISKLKKIPSKEELDSEGIFEISSYKIEEDKKTGAKNLAVTFKARVLDNGAISHPFNRIDVNAMIEKCKNDNRQIFRDSSDVEELAQYLFFRKSPKSKRNHEASNKKEMNSKKDLQELKTFANNLTKDLSEDDYLGKAKKIYQFIIDSSSYDEKETQIETLSANRLGLAGVMRVIRERKGICRNFADTFVALCLYSGIPARIKEGGFILKDGENLGFLDYSGKGMNRFGDSGYQNHQWVELYIPDRRWIMADPTFGIDHKDENHFGTANPRHSRKDKNKTGYYAYQIVFNSLGDSSIMSIEEIK